MLRIALVLSLALGSCAPPVDRQSCGKPDRGDAAPVEVSADGRKALDSLLGLMRQRLLIQHEVAAFKWHAKLSITDPKREQELLAQTRAQAGLLGLEPDFVREFFRAQVEAGKLVQQADFDTWQKAGPPATGVDLKALRLRIDVLNGGLLEAMKDTGPWLNQEAGKKVLQARANVVLQGDGITLEIRRAACAPLLRP
jgi:chorismate mutase